MKKKPRVITAFKIDPELLAEAKKQNIQLRPIIEAAIAKVLKVKKCPYCGK